MNLLSENEDFPGSPNRWAEGADADAVRRYSKEELANAVRRIMSQRNTLNGVWVFGYGSLMWNPDVCLQESRRGMLEGYHRRLCVQSTVYRGTRKTPGVVLGLDTGGFCEGVVFHIAFADLEPELLRLWEREMFADTYVPTWVKVKCEQGCDIEALAFVVNRGHEHYLAPQELDRLARYVFQARGQKGHCREYLFNTVTSLHRMGLRDPVLERVLMQADDLSESNF